MSVRRHVRGSIVAAAAAVLLSPITSHGFPQSTDTIGELPTDLNGVWLVVHHLKFERPTPTATPAATATPAGGASPAEGASPAAPTPARTAAPAVSPAAGSAGSDAAAKAPDAGATPSVRIFNVLTLLTIRHLEKEEAQVLRDAEARLQQASIERAKKLAAELGTKELPVQKADGTVEGGPQVIVPNVPQLPDSVADKGDDVRITLIEVAPPKSIEESLQKAQEAEQPWRPTAKDLALLKSSWQSLKPVERGEYSRIEWKVTPADQYDQSLENDPAVRGSKIAIAGNQQLIPRPGQANTNVVVYGMREIEDGRITGSHVRAIMASAPFPIPIEMKGDFEMYKVAEFPEEPGAAKPTAKPTVKAP